MVAPVARFKNWFANRKTTPRSQVDRQRYTKGAPRQWAVGRLTAQQVYNICESNYTVSTVLDAVCADSTQVGWEWRVENPDKPIHLDDMLAQHNAEALLRNPNPQDSGKDLLAQIRYELEAGGDAFVEVVWGTVYNDIGEAIGRQPAELWVVPCWTMELLPVDTTGVLPACGPAYQQRVGGKVVATFTADEIIHIRGGSKGGRLYGTPKLLSVLALIAIQAKSISYNVKLFADGRPPNAIVSLDASIEDIQRLLDENEKRMAHNPHTIPFLAAKGANVLRVMDSIKDMQMLDMLKFCERTILARWRTPPVSIGISEAGGAGIVVGETQVDKYWDMVEEGNEKISEAFTKYLRRYMGLENHYLHILSARPDKAVEQATVDAAYLDRGVYTINEVRNNMGLAPVDWGAIPWQPAVPANQLFNAHSSSMLPNAGNMVPGLLGSKHTLAQAPPSYTPKVQPIHAGNGGCVPAQKAAPATSGMDKLVAPLVVDMVNSMLAVADEMRADVLRLVKSVDIITKAEGIDQESLVQEATKIMQAYTGDMDAATVRYFAEAYIGGKGEQAEDLLYNMAWGEDDYKRLDAMRVAWSNTAIRTFQADQVKIIQDSLQAVAAEPDLYKYRVLVEEQLETNLWREDYKLERIARTSLNRSYNRGRGTQMQEVLGVSDPDVDFITAGDERVRASHRDAGARSPIPLSEAMRFIEGDINCRCRIVRTLTELPPGVPSASQLVEDITQARQDALAEAIARYQEAA